MPIFDIVCRDCGKSGEVVTVSATAAPVCPACGGTNTDRLMSPTSSLTGRGGQGLPGPGDTSCCGSTPGRAGCAGPGSCCGKA